MVKEIEFGPSTTFDLKVSTYKSELVNQDTYDSTAIRVSFNDEHGNVMEYASNILEISTTGPIELIGSSIQALLGGQLTLFVKSKQGNGQGKVIIKSDDLVKEITLTVK